MDIDYIKQNYIFETLTDEHDLSDFESDSKDLNDFLKNDALNQLMVMQKIINSILDITVSIISKEMMKK